MDFPHKLVWFAGDDRTGTQPLIIRRIFPSFPQRGKHEWRIVLHAGQKRNFTAVNFLPFVETISRNQAAPFLERLSVCSIDRFSPRSHDLVYDFRIFGPVRNQASERIAFAVYAIRDS